MRRKLLPSLEEEGPDEPLINLTPLIDVVFVVLITFMLIAPVLDIDLVELAPGGSSSKKEASSTPLAISLRADNSIWFQGKQMNLTELEKALKREKLRYPGHTPQLIPDKSAQFGTYQAVKNTLELCGFTQMDVLLQPQ
jgi:biopolymer transport protein ExbD